MVDITILLSQACGEYALLAQTQGRKWQRMLSHEHEQRRRLEDMVEQLARQHSHLEQAAQQQARSSVPNPNPSSGPIGPLAHSIHSEEDEDNEFFDAEDEVNNADYIVQVPIGHRRTPSTSSQVIHSFNPIDCDNVRLSYQAGHMYTGLFVLSTGIGR